MGERDLARSRIAAAAGECRGARRVVRRAKGTHAPGLRMEAAGERGDGGARECLLLGERRQESRHALGEHRLSRSRRADHQQTVPAGRGDRQRTLRVCLAADFLEVRECRFADDARRGRQRQNRFAPGQVCADVQQCRGRMHDRIADERRFRCIGRRQHERAAGAARPQHHRQGPADRSQRAAERQLAGEFVQRERVRWDLTRRREDADRDRQVETAGFLGQVRGSEVDGDLAGRELELRVLQRRAHTFTRFFDLGVGQTHKIECRQPAGEMHFHRHRRRIEAGQGA